MAPFYGKPGIIQLYDQTMINMRSCHTIFGRLISAGDYVSSGLEIQSTQNEFQIHFFYFPLFSSSLLCKTMQKSESKFCAKTFCDKGVVRHWIEKIAIISLQYSGYRSIFFAETISPMTDEPNMIFCLYWNDVFFSLVPVKHFWPGVSSLIFLQRLINGLKVKSIKAFGFKLRWNFSIRPYCDRITITKRSKLFNRQIFQCMQYPGSFSICETREPLNSIKISSFLSRTSFVNFSSEYLLNWRPGHVIKNCDVFHSGHLNKKLPI